MQTTDGLFIKFCWCVHDQDYSVSEGDQKPSVAAKPGRVFGQFKLLVSCDLSFSIIIIASILLQYYVFN